MAITPTYPGVYVQDVPSGVRTISGVATSITAFIGRALRGPVDTPVMVNSFADFERTFGGLWVDGPMSYAVRDFFLNGGGQAIVVRLYKAAGGPDNEHSGTAKLKLDELELLAASPGAWGNRLQVRIDKEGITEDVAKRYNLSVADLFNLRIDLDGQVEQFPNLSLIDGPRQIDRVLAQQSQFVRVADKLPKKLPDLKPTADPKLGESTTLMSVGTAAGGDESKPLTTKADFTGVLADKKGMYALENADLFNMLCIPPDTRAGTVPNEVYSEALAYSTRRNAMLIVDPPANWNPLSNPPTTNAIALNGTDARNAALFYPRIRQSDPLREGQVDTFVPCGAVAGVIARTDAQRGVWKAPAGIDAALNGVIGLDVPLNDANNGRLNPLGINCLRSFPAFGPVIWGARTMRGSDQLADEYKYLPVRRLALYLRESLYRGLQWVVFEPNDEPLWSQIRLNVGAFMQNLFRQGAFQGRTPRDAYFVKCDKDTTTQNDINLGVVNVVVGFAPLKPAEFVIVSLQQIAGQIAV